MYLVNTLPTRGQLHIAIGPTTVGGNHSYFLRRAGDDVEVHRADGRLHLVRAELMSAILGPVFDDWWNQ